VWVCDLGHEFGGPFESCHVLTDLTCFALCHSSELRIVVASSDCELDQFIGFPAEMYKNLSGKQIAAASCRARASLFADPLLTRLTDRLSACLR
jgi:hypothetical protein